MKTSTLIVGAAVVAAVIYWQRNRVPMSNAASGARLPTSAGGSLPALPALPALPTLSNFQFGQQMPRMPTMPPMPAMGATW